MSYSDIKAGLDKIYTSVYRVQNKIDSEVIQKLDKQIETIKSSKLTQSEIKKIAGSVSLLYSIMNEFVQETMVKSNETLKTLGALNGILRAKSTALSRQSAKKQLDKDNAVLDSFALKQLEELQVSIRTKTSGGVTRRHRRRRVNTIKIR